MHRLNGFMQICIALSELLQAAYIVLSNFGVFLHEVVYLRDYFLLNK